MTAATAYGFWQAVGCSFFFAAYILPRKLSRLSVHEYQVWLGMMVPVVAVLVAVSMGAPFAAGGFNTLLALSCGIIWTFGSLCYSSAVDCIGVARSTPVKNLAPMFASLYGIFLFHEYSLRDPESFAMALGGVALMVGAAFVIGRASAPENETATAYDSSLSTEARRRAFFLGWLFSVGAAFFYGLYSIPLKTAVVKGEMNPYSANVFLGFGIFATSWLWFAIRERRVMPQWPGRKEAAISQLAAVLWTPGQILGTVAMANVAMSISWPVSNLSTLLTVAWGVWVFHEVHLERHVREVIAALALYAGGLALLFFAAPHGRV